MTRVATKAELPGVFGRLADRVFKGVPGVQKIEIGRAKKTLVIFALTHGGEPAGLYAIDWILKNKHLLHDVRLILGIGNLDGAHEFFKSSMPDDRSEFARRGGNMNRLPPGDPALWPSPLPSYTRAAALWKDVFCQYSIAGGIDYHSTPQPLINGGIAMEIAGDSLDHDHIISTLPVRHYLRGLTAAQLEKGSRTRPFGTIFNGPAIEIETGSYLTGEEASRRLAVESVIGFLYSHGVLSMGIETQQTFLQHIYDVEGAIMVPHHRFRVPEKALLTNFARVREGAILLEGTETDEKILMPKDGRVVFCWSDRVLETLRPDDVPYELFFLLSEGDVRCVRSMPRFKLEL